MGATLQIRRTDHASGRLRVSASRCRDGAQVRRLLALAMVSDSHPCSEVPLADEQHVAPPGHTAIAVIESVNGRIVLVVAAQRGQRQHVRPGPLNPSILQSAALYLKWSNASFLLPYQILQRLDSC
jgi:hypothetical protein